MARWATNLLVSGVILIAGLAGGRQALEWWSAGQRSPVDHAAEVVGPDEALTAGQQLLEFGESPLVFTRSMVEGDAAAALRELRRVCRQVVERVGPVERPAGPAERPAGPAELRLVAGTRALEPVESSGQWRMYELPGPWPMVVAVADDSGSPPSPLLEPAGGAPEIAQVAAAGSRVVSWGLAFSADPDTSAAVGRWTLLTCAADGGDAESRGAAFPMPIPPGARRTLKVVGESGAVMAGFRGPGEADDWMQFYDRALPDAGWRAGSPWRSALPTWQRRFAGPRGEQCDVQLAAGADGFLNGLLLVAPSSDAPAGK